MWHPDGYIEIKDRSKDIIISGGENISTLEVEEVPPQHPAVIFGSRGGAARPDLGRNALRIPGIEAGLKEVSETEIIQFCRQSLARFKVPKRVVFGELPKTSTGKIQKFTLRERAAGRDGEPGQEAMLRSPDSRRFVYRRMENRIRAAGS